MRTKAATLFTVGVMMSMALGTSYARAGNDSAGAAVDGLAGQTKPTVMRRPSVAPTTATMFLLVAGVPGSSTAAGHEEEVEVLSFSFGVLSPRSPSTGAAMGRRQYEPLVVTKRVDKASPALISALINNTVLSRVELSFHGSGGLIYRIKLTNAALVSLQQQTPENRGSMPVEELSFSFQGMEWLWADGNISVTDSLSGTV